MLIHGIKYQIDIDTKYDYYIFFKYIPLVLNDAICKLIILLTLSKRIKPKWPENLRSPKNDLDDFLRACFGQFIRVP